MHYETTPEVTSEYAIEVASLADVSAIMELSKGAPEALLEGNETELAEWVVNGDALVARHESGQVVGHYAAQRWPESGAVELRTAVVHPDHRGQGLNTAMLETLTATLHDEGIEPFVMTRPAAMSRGILERSGGIITPLGDIPDEVFSYCPDDCYRQTGHSCGCQVYRMTQQGNGSQS